MRRILINKGNDLHTKRTDGTEPDRIKKNKNYKIFPIKEACFIAVFMG